MAHPRAPALAELSYSATLSNPAVRSPTPHSSSSPHHRLLAPRNPLLATWGAKLPFEIAVGMNGRVWVKTGDEDAEGCTQMCREIKGR